MGNARKKLGVGLYGTNGHQIQNHFPSHLHAELVASAGIERDALPEALKSESAIRHYATLAELLADDWVELVSLCSPRRRDQARDAIAAMQAGKHVYAEKPCAMTESDLDAIIATANKTGRHFNEMAGTAFDQPYWAMREVMAAGTIGAVVQVLAQKSYPYHDGRPQDEDVDGGLIGQNSVHALRMIEHVAEVRIAEINAFETSFGNPVAGGGLRMAASITARLENGGVASVVANYLNRRVGTWGNETLRIWGTLGFIEMSDGGTRTRLVVGDVDHGPLDTSARPPDYFDLIVAAAQGRGERPYSMEDELHPTRMAIRAKRAAETRSGN